MDMMHNSVTIMWKGKSKVKTHQARNQIVVVGCKKYWQWLHDHDQDDYGFGSEDDADDVDANNYNGVNYDES